MKSIFYILLLLHASCMSLFSQNESLKTDSLPVFVVIDKDVSDILNNFIMEAENYSNHYPSVAFFMYIGLNDNDIPFSLELNLNKRANISDSIMLYKNPNCSQILVSHRNQLFVTVVCKYPNFDNRTNFPTAILRKAKKKHKVYYKDPPEDYFRDNPTKGEVIYENQIIGWLCYQDCGYWQVASKISF